MDDDTMHESTFSDAELQRAVREMQAFAKESKEDRRGIREEVTALRDEVRTLRGQVADVQSSQLTKADLKTLLAEHRDAQELAQWRQLKKVSVRLFAGVVFSGPVVAFVVNWIMS